MEEKHIPYLQNALSDQEMLEKSAAFYQKMDKRRTVRDFSSDAIPKKVIEHIIQTASTAPSGANKQPWVFCVVTSTEVKNKIRKAAEEVEKENYDTRMSDRWKEDLAHLGTNEEKLFLDEAPVLIVVFKKSYDLKEGVKSNNYYVNESVGIACGMLISAIHEAGLVTVTHTPSPMSFLAKILNRPENERPYLLLPVGKPKNNAVVPDIKRKQLSEVISYY